MLNVYIYRRRYYIVNHKKHTMKSISSWRQTHSYACDFQPQHILKSFLSLFLFAFIILSQAFGQSANLDQIRNGKATDPTNWFYSTVTSSIFYHPSWVNGNAGSSDAHYVESYSIGYRSLLTGVTAGRTYDYVIQYDTKHSGRMAIDYLTTYQRLDPHFPYFHHNSEILDPRIFQNGSVLYLLGGGLVAPTTFPIPAPFQANANTPVSGMPQNSFNALPASERMMTIYNGTITNISYDEQQSLTTSSTDATVTVRIRFTAIRDSVVLTWGGHIASKLDWGYLNPTTPRSASGISGSPYHMRHLVMYYVPATGSPVKISLGNQDRSLSAAAVIAPPDCLISAAQLACPETASLTYSYTGSATGLTFLWAISGANTAGAMISGSATGSSVTIVPIGADFVPGGTFDLTLTIDQNGFGAACTRSPAGTITNVTVTASASPTIINLQTGNTSQLNAAISPGVNSDYTIAWVQTPASGGALSSTSIYNPVFTATSAGDYKFVVTATQIAAPHCTKKDSVVISVTASAPPCGVAGPSPVCPGSTNSYVYDPSHNGGAAESLPANFTAEWSLINNTNGATLSGSSPHTGNSVSVVAGANCGTSYTVRITLTSTSGLITVHCDTTVTVNVSAPPVITNCPADVVVQCIGDTAASNTGVMTATGNCGVNITHSNSVQSGCITIITRTWTATDPCGNTATCVQHIIVRDRTAPSITCHGYPNDATATDNCTGAITIYHRDDGGTRTWTAVDASGNTATCSEAISIQNPIVPSVANNNNNNGNNVSKGDNPVVIKPTVKSESGLQIQAYPNPFSVDVTFQFVSKTSGEGTLEIYNLTGQKIARVFNGKVIAGMPYTAKYKAPFGASNALVYRLTVNGKSETGKIFQGDK
jgi:hypothetical protein